MRQSTVALLAVLAATLIAAWFFTTHERVTRTQFIGYSGEARFNDFLAADMLLNALGYEADSRSSLAPSEWLPDVNDALVARVSDAFSTEEQRGLLATWVADGGHLILLPAKYESRMGDELLDYLGFRLVEIEDDEGGRAEDENQESQTPETYAYTLDLDSTRYRIQASWEEDLSATLSDERGMIAARRQWGSGFITVVADSNYFRNSFIGDSDHGRLLMDTAAGYIEPGKVWFIYDAVFPPLWKVIWDNAPYVVISFSIMLVVWLWSIMPRFGPAILPVPPIRRSIMEHIGAAGKFIWRHAGAKTLARSAAAAVMHQAEFSHPGISRLPVQKQSEQIARTTDFPAQTIFDVLVNRDEPRHREFTHNMQALQRIRQKL